MKRRRSSLADDDKTQKQSKAISPEAERFFENEKIYTGKENFTRIFDFYYCISLSKDHLDDKKYASNGLQENQLKLFVKQLISMLTEGMAERFEELGVYSEHFKTKKITLSKIELSIGFRASSNWSNPLTIGPIGNAPEAATFREFWGDKSDLRKFGDNTIKEAILWADNGSDNVPNKILIFLLEKEFAIPPSCVSFCCHLKPIFLPHRPTFEVTTSAFAKLNGFLRGLKDIPLSVTTIIGTSPFLRGTEPLESTVRFSMDSNKIDEELGIALPNENEGCFWTRSIDVFIRLEYSHRWGNEVELIHQLIIAFYVLLSEQLRKQWNLYCHPTTGALYVQVDKTAFRIVIINEKILAILKSQVEQMKASGVEGVDKSTESTRLALFTRIYKIEPAIKQQLAAISLRYRHFSAACQLFKLWLGRQMLSGYLHELAIELLVAAVFETNSYQPIPRSAIAAFNRVLRLLTTHDWLRKPLIVDLDGKWADESRVKVEEDFLSMRPVLPPMVISIQEDPTGTMWTSDTPSFILMHRLLAVAKRSMELIENCFTSEAINDLNQLFQQQELQFDARIVIDSSFHVDRKRIKVKGKQSEHNLPVLDFHPVELLAERLNNDFQKIALFFYDRYTVNEIGLKWKDPILKIDAKIGNALFYMFEGEDRQEMVINKREVYETIGLMGTGMVSQILEKDQIAWKSESPSSVSSNMIPPEPSNGHKGFEKKSSIKTSRQEKKKLSIDPTNGTLESKKAKNKDSRPITPSKENGSTSVEETRKNSAKTLLRNSLNRDALREFLRDPSAPQFNSPKETMIIDSTSCSETEDENQMPEIPSAKSSKTQKQKHSVNGNPAKKLFKNKVSTPGYRRQTVASKLKRTCKKKTINGAETPTTKKTKKGKNGAKPLIFDL